MAESPPKQFFSVEEANRRLPLVRAIVEDIVRLYRDVHERRERLVRVRQLPGRGSSEEESNPYDEELDQIEQELELDINRLEEFVDELRALGVELKDPVTGLVDFRTHVDGREAYLCWQLGEDDIAFWHELDGGFRGRQPIYEASISGDQEQKGDAAE